MSTITGNAGGFDRNNPLAFNSPSDGEGIDAADVNVPFQDLADGVEDYRQYGAKVDVQNTFTTVQSIVPSGALNDDQWLLRLKEAIGGSWQNTILLDDDAGAGNMQRRIYMGTSGVLAITVNAYWDPNGPNLWFTDDVASPATRFRFTNAKWYVDYHAAGVSWAEGAWTSARIEISSSTGDLQAQGALTAGTSVTATTFVQAGSYVLAAAGNVRAEGDPASDQARVKCKQIVSQAAAAPTAEATNKTGADNGGGDATETVVAGSTDIKGRITVTTGAATGNGDIVRVTFNKAYPSAPEVVIVPTNADTANLGWVPYVSTATTHFDITSGTGANKLATTTTYGWAYMVIG